jgi:succinate dehydrogenase / fumarate reductase cytochrome b subunit
MTQAEGKPRGVAAWLFQRLTAVLLAYFLFWHIIVLHFLNTKKITLDLVLARVRENEIFWMTFYAIFIPSLLFHAMNGLWSVFLDYDPPGLLKRIVLALLWVTGILLTIIGLVTVKALVG